MPPQSNPPRPPLTHFLCLPLLTPTSTPQLRASIAHLKSVIHALEPATPDARTSLDGEPSPPQTRPLVPEAAFRPLGTLHLTLGVMSLQDPKKLQGALKLLQELDLEGMLREVSIQNSSQGQSLAESSSSKPDAGEPMTSIPSEAHHGINSGLETAIPPPPTPTLTLPPLSLTLRGLSPFPPTIPQTSTVLHTPPYDATQRLHPFCLRVLHAFTTSGYITADRPLTLHATLINTVYAPRPRSHPAQRGRGRGRRPSKLTFDSTPLLRIFNERGGQLHPPPPPPPPPPGSLSSTTRSCTATAATSDPVSGPPDTESARQEQRGDGRFVFAADVRVDAVQICEMGAREVDDEEGKELGLGNRYVVVGERRMEWV